MRTACGNGSDSVAVTVTGEPSSTRGAAETVTLTVSLMVTSTEDGEPCDSPGIRNDPSPISPTVKVSSSLSPSRIVSTMPVPLVSPAGMMISRSPT